jgi:hypothetical protein
MAIPVSLLGIVSVVMSSIAVLAVGGCGSIGVALGMRTRLAKLPIVSISATLHPHAGLSPGESGRLIIVATAADGHTLTSVGAGQGTVLFDSFTFSRCRRCGEPQNCHPNLPVFTVRLVRRPKTRGGTPRGAEA